MGGLGEGAAALKTELLCRKATSDGRPRASVAEARGPGERETDGEAGQVCPAEPCDTIKGLVLILRTVGSRCCCFFNFYLF